MFRWRWRRRTMKMEQSYWMHRCTCGDYAWQFTHELLKKHQFISIGWSDFSNNETQPLLTKDWSSFEKVFVDAGWGLPRNRYNLWRFLNEMKKDDIVVVPLPYLFDVYRIVDDIVYNNTTMNHDLWVDWNGEAAKLDDKGYPAFADGRQIDMGFYRKVEPVALDIPRSDYAQQSLYSRLKIQQTNADITDLKCEVDLAVERFKEKRPINLRSTYSQKAAEILCGQIRDLLNDSKLESLVAWYMDQLGANTIIPSKNSVGQSEGDADVIATFGRLNGFTILIQVKAHKGYTDSWAVEQISTYKRTIERRRDIPSAQLWVVSTCDDFDAEAKRRAEEEGVRLINGLEFAQMIVENGVYSLPL